MAERAFTSKPNSHDRAWLQRKTSLRVGAPDDTYEREADRAADAVMNGHTLPTALSLSRIPITQVQREEGGEPKSEEDKYKEAAGKLGEAFLETSTGKKIKEAGEEFLDTLPGKVITGTAAAGVVAGLAASHKELPLQIPEIPLDKVAPGLKVKITYEGPVDNPSKAMIAFTYTPQAGGDKPAKTKTEQLREENARIAQEQAKFRASLRYKPGSLEAKRQEAEEEAFRRAAFGNVGKLPDFGNIKPMPVLQQPSSALPLQLPSLSFGYKPKPFSLLDEELKLKPISEVSGAKEQEKKKEKGAPVQLQRKASSEAGGAAPSIVSEVVNAPGRPLEPSTRGEMEARFGRDFRNVRVHTDTQAATSAQAIGALGYTVGAHIVFGAQQYAPGTQQGKALLAHELSHVVQQQAAGEKTLARKPVDVSAGKPIGQFNFEAKIERINTMLSYGFWRFDFVITDAEAMEALELIESMTSTERISAMSQIDVARLEDNLPTQYRPWLNIIKQQVAGETADLGKITRLLSYNLWGFDFVITDDEAREALHILEQMPPQQRMHALMGINRERLEDNLPQVLKPSFAMMWDEARRMWNRERQQRDPLAPGDAIRIQVYNALAQEHEARFEFEKDVDIVVNKDYEITLPLLGQVKVRNLRPSDIELKISALLRERQMLQAARASVEVTRRSGERFKAREQAISTSQPDETTRLDPGDTFELIVVAVWHKEEDLSRSYQLDLQGNIVMEHLGVVSVGGMTRKEVAAQVNARLSGWFKEPPNIWVYITSHAGRLYRAEDIGKPGALPSGKKSELADKPIPRRTQTDIYLDFVRMKQAEIAKPEIKTRDRELIQHAVLKLLDWMQGKNEEQLAATNPWEVFERIHTPMLIGAIKSEARRKVEEETAARRDAARDAAVNAKLDEYWEWAKKRWNEAGVVFRSLGPAYLLTESPLRGEAMNALTSAVLEWAYAHTDDPAFLTRSPDEVAVYLQKISPVLATIIRVGEEARPTVEYFPELDRTRYTLGELAVETLVGFIPIIGDIGDATQAATGVSLTGHELETSDRVLMGIGAIIPFVPGSALRGGKKLPEVIEKVALTTGRRAEEIEAIFRVAGHLHAEDVTELERIIKTVNQGKRLMPADLDVLDKIALKLKGPLEEAARLLGKGEKIPIGKLRADIITGTRFILGTAEHKMQRWIEYQFRHPELFPRLSNVIDPEWERLYEGIIKNKRAGGAFEQEVLSVLKYEKNTAVMMKGGKQAGGFIPDAVKGNPAELIWGKAYDFLEVKGWKEMSLTGNLVEMLDYVDKFGGHIEVVFRSEKAAGGATSLSAPLEKLTSRLEKEGKATVIRYP